MSSSAITYAQAPQARQKNKFKPQTQGSSGAPTRLRCVKQNKTKCGCTIRRKTNKKYRSVTRHRRIMPRKPGDSLYYKSVTVARYVRMVGDMRCLRAAVGSTLTGSKELVPHKQLTSRRRGRVKNKKNRGYAKKKLGCATGASRGKSVSRQK